MFFTARKRSLRRLCFYTCLSVILFTGGYTPQAGTPLPQAGTPPWQVHPPGKVPPAGTPPVQCMLGYSQQAGGTHPTGMHSCTPVCDSVYSRGSLSWGVSVLGGSLSWGGVSVWRDLCHGNPTETPKSGCHASYWKCILVISIVIRIMKKAIHPFRPLLLPSQLGQC